MPSGSPILSPVYPWSPNDGNKRKPNKASRQTIVKEERWKSTTAHCFLPRFVYVFNFFSFPISCAERFRKGRIKSWWLFSPPCLSRLHCVYPFFPLRPVVI